MAATAFTDEPEAEACDLDNFACFFDIARADLQNIGIQTESWPQCEKGTQTVTDQSCDHVVHTVCGPDAIIHGIHEALRGRLSRMEDIFVDGIKCMIHDISSVHAHLDDLPHQISKARHRKRNDQPHSETMNATSEQGTDYGAKLAMQEELPTEPTTSSGMEGEVPQCLIDLDNKTKATSSSCTDPTMSRIGTWMKLAADIGKNKDTMSVSKHMQVLKAVQENIPTHWYWAEGLSLDHMVDQLGALKETSLKVSV